MVKPFQFGTKKIGPGNPAYIIAEIGVNHEGNVEDCARMIKAAADAGADAIKLQTCDPEENYVPGTESYELFKTCELSKSETAQMFQYARDLKIDPFTTSPDPITLEWVNKLNPAGHKISSGMMTNPVIIKKTAQTGKPVLMSTGMANEEQIDEAVSWVKDYGDMEQLGLFQCTSIYPAPYETLNLSTIRAMQERYNVPVGFSDHTEGTDIAAAAVFAGAHIIEKHFTLDKTRPSFDHKLSLEPTEMALLVKKVREAEIILGQATKSVEGNLANNAVKYLRTLVARRDIQADEILDENNVALKRALPDKRGMEAKQYDFVLGQRTRKALTKNEPITEQDIYKS